MRSSVYHVCSWLTIVYLYDKMPGEGSDEIRLGQVLIAPRTTSDPAMWCMEKLEA